MKKTQGTSIRSTFLIIQALVALLLVFLVVQGVILWRVCQQGSQATVGLEREGIPSMEHIAVLKQNLNLYRLRSYEMMFVQEGERAAKATEADSLHRENLDLLVKLQALFPTGQGKQLVADAENSLTNYVGTMTRVRGSMEKDFAAAMQMLDKEVPPQVKRLSEAADKLETYCDDIAAGRVRETVGGFGHIKKTALGFGSASIGFSALVLVLVMMSSHRIRQRLAGLVSRLAEGSEQVHHSAGSVSAASHTLAEGASEQAASLEETSASLEEMASMTHRNTETAQHVKSLANAARQAGDTGASDMKAMSTAMLDIKRASDDVAKIVKTIDEIAFQTNLLALNAAVEAARAGEAGMGFAVVADEVRSLAQRAAAAAKETSEKIADSVSKSGHGVQISSKVAASLEEIILKARQVDELAAQVATASGEQSQGITQVNTAIGQMDKVTQANAANAEESSSAAQELNAQAETMKEAVAELLGLVGGNIQSTHDHAGSPVAKQKTAAPSRKTNGGRLNGNGRATLPVKTSSRAAALAIPMDGDFKEF